MAEAQEVRRSKRIARRLGKEADASTQTPGHQTYSVIVDDPEPESSPWNGYASHLVSGQFADFSVTCKGYVFRVYQLIISTRSEYFKKICDSGFMETGKKIITFDDEDPRIVARLLIFLYTENYPRNFTDFMFNSQAYSQFMEFARDQHISPLSHSAAVLDMQMYAIGNRFLLNNLKCLALRRFASDFLRSMYFNGPISIHETEEIIDMAKTIHGITPDSDRGLRDILLIGLHRLTDKNNLEAQPLYLEFLSRNMNITRELLSSSLCDQHCAECWVKRWRCYHCGNKGKILKRKCACLDWRRCRNTDSKTDCGKTIICVDCGQKGHTFRYISV